MDYEDITCVVDEGVAVITLNRPAVLNAFRAGTTAEVEAAVRVAEADPAVRCLVLTGAGRAFCAGADLKDLADGRGGSDWTDRSEAPPAPMTATSGGMFHTGKVLIEASKPTIAAVNGLCVGGGLMFCLASDIRIASDRARFSVMFTKRGLTPETGVSYFLPRIVGLDNALLMTYTGDMFTAEQALAMRLVTRVVDHESLLDETMALARSIAAMPTMQLGLAKKQMRFGLQANQLELSYLMEAWGLMNAQRTEDYLEGHRSFYEKRDPQFRGR